MDQLHPKNGQLLNDQMNRPLKLGMHTPVFFSSSFFLFAPALTDLGDWRRSGLKPLLVLRPFWYI